MKKLVKCKRVLHLSQRAFSESSKGLETESTEEGGTRPRSMSDGALQGGMADERTGDDAETEVQCVSWKVMLLIYCPAYYCVILCYIILSINF